MKTKALLKEFKRIVDVYNPNYPDSLLDPPSPEWIINDIERKTLRLFKNEFIDIPIIKKYIESIIREMTSNIKIDSIKDIEKISFSISYMDSLEELIDKYKENYFLYRILDIKEI